MKNNLKKLESWLNKNKFYKESATIRRLASDLTSNSFNNYVELYHSTLSGDNDSIIKSIISGVDSKRSKGFGQGAGFYLWTNKDQAIRHAKGLLNNEFDKEEKVSGRPIIVVMEEEVSDFDFDIDYELDGKDLISFILKNKDWFKSRINLFTGPGSPIQNLKFNDDINTFSIRVGRSQKSFGVMHDDGPLFVKDAQFLSSLGSAIAQFAPDKFKEFELEAFKKTKAIKYVGEKRVIPKRIEDLEGNIIWERESSVS